MESSSLSYLLPVGVRNVTTQLRRERLNVFNITESQGMQELDSKLRIPLRTSFQTKDTKHPIHLYIHQRQCILKEQSRLEAYRALHLLIPFPYNASVVTMRKV